MSGKLTREELKEPTAEEKIAYQNRINAARVAAYRQANKRNLQNITENLRKII